MQPKISRLIMMTFFLIAIAGISGCAPYVNGILATEGGLERVEGIRRYFDGMGYGYASAYILTLPERRFIRQIVIHPNGPIKGLDIYVRSGEAQWKRIEQIKGRKESAVIINTAVSGDAIRVIQKAQGYVGEIEVFAASR